MDDIVTRTMTHPPVDTRFVGGIWHPGRLSLRGVWTEARVWGSSLLSPTNRDVKKFLIISRARSGSTLLTQLLNSHPDVHCARELLAKRVFFPERYLNRLAQKSTATAYGMKLLSYQMVQVQRLKDPVRFLTGLEQRGFRFIHLERDTFAQTVSLMIAQTKKLFHQNDGSKAGVGRHLSEEEERKAQAPVQIDIEDFIRRLEWNDMLLEYERYCLKKFAHLTVSYEADLQDQTVHQPMADRVFDWIGVPPVPVTGRLKKILPSDSRQVLANYDDLTAQMRQQGLERLLPE